jgi:hypothetical protein
MLDISRVLKEDRLLRAFTGLNRKAFDELSVAFEMVLNTLRDRQKQKVSETVCGWGQKSSITASRRQAIFHLVLLQMLSHLCVPDEVPIHVDLGFQGLQKEFVNIKIPDKKPRGRQLTEEQKQSNREKSSERVKCEHTIAGIKRYKAATALYRNHIRDLDDRFMLTAAGLWNFYLMAA